MYRIFNSGIRFLVLLGSKNFVAPFYIFQITFLITFDFIVFTKLFKTQHADKINLRVKFILTDKVNFQFFYFID